VELVEGDVGVRQMFAGALDQGGACVDAHLGHGLWGAVMGGALLTTKSGE
jgi:hypothetical protein